MKSRKNSKNIMIVLLCSAMLLDGCGTYDQTNTAVTPVITPTNIVTCAPTIAPTVTPAIMAGTVFEDVSKDLDGNGVDDSIQIISKDNAGATCMLVYLNSEKIFEYENPYLRLMGIDTFEYLDLDGDNANEIFITAGTNANCRAYEEVLCLKQTDSKWNQMDFPKNDVGYNEFTFKVTRGKGEFDFVISSDDTEQVLHFDASQYYKDEESGNIDSIQKYRENNYKEGDEVGFISAWGIWGAKTGTYEGRNCIIALEGMEGPYGHGLGEVNIYYAYSQQGQVEILNVEYLAE